MDVFAPRRALRTRTPADLGPDPLPPGPDAYASDDGPPARTVEAGRLAGAGASGRGPDGLLRAEGLSGDPSDGGPDGERGPRRAPAGRGRTFTGIAAAAVTTVLAVVVAGQVTHGRTGHSPESGRRQGHVDAAPRAGEHPHQAPAPLTYDQKMSVIFPLDPHLKASGRFEPVPGHDRAPGPGRLYRYRVDVEQGLGLDAALFAQAIQKTLNDRRSWAHGGVRAFERISSGRPDFVVTLASPGTTAAWCAKSGLDTVEENVSCDSAATDRVLINAYRWARGAATYGDDRIHAYRQMLINHEIGHRLGYDHVFCAKNGALAPVMQQQTKFLTYNGVTCRPNPWPNPDK